MIKWFRLFVTFTLGLFLGIAALLLFTRSNMPVVEAQDDEWPSPHKNLSVSSADSTNPDIEAVRLGNGKKVVAVVWMEGRSDVEILGTIKMRWKFEGQSGTWRISSSQMFPVQSGYAYGYPAMALHPGQSSVDAHLVWFQKDPSNNQQVVYRKCTLSETGVTCGAIEMLGAQNSVAPDIAVDGDGIPHVVWQGKHEGFDAIYYNNRAGGNWGTPWAIRTLQGVSGVNYLRALGQSPKIVVYGKSGVPGSVVAVVWDREVGPGGTGEQPGLFTSFIGTWFGRRDTLGSVSTVNEAEHWELIPISQPGGGGIASELWDNRPRLAVGQTGVYVVWDRLVSQTTGAFVWTRVYDLAYRVFLPPYTGTVETGWWPGTWAYTNTWPSFVYQAPYSATTWVPKDVVGTDQDLYSGGRPSVRVVASGGSDQMHIVWQHSQRSSGGGGEMVVAGEGDVDGYPLQVWHAVATHTLSSGNMAVSAWVSRQITVQQPVNGFFANPSLAVIPNDGPPHPHVALLDRFKTTSAYAWDVWYVNDKQFLTADRDPTVYLPIVLKNYY